MRAGPTAKDQLEREDQVDVVRKPDRNPPIELAIRLRLLRTYPSAPNSRCRRVSQRSEIGTLGQLGRCDRTVVAKG